MPRKAKQEPDDRKFTVTLTNPNGSKVQLIVLGQQSVNAVEAKAAQRNQTVEITEGAN